MQPWHHLLFTFPFRCCRLHASLNQMDPYNYILASCPWGPATANGVGILTELYVIYMEGYTSHRAIAWCFGLGLYEGPRSNGSTFLRLWTAYGHFVGNIYGYHDLPWKMQSFWPRRVKYLTSVPEIKGPSIKFNVASKRKFMTNLLQTPPPPSIRKPTVRWNYLYTYKVNAILVVCWIICL